MESYEPAGFWKNYQPIEPEKPDWLALSYQTDNSNENENSIN